MQTSIPHAPEGNYVKRRIKETRIILDSVPFKIELNSLFSWPFVAYPYQFLTVVLRQKSRIMYVNVDEPLRHRWSRHLVVIVRNGMVS